MKKIWQSAWAPWLLIGLAAMLRAWKLGDWSLWEDEETTIYFSQNIGKPFPRFFPVFFLALREWFQVTGLSVLAGRVLAAAIGVVGVGATYEVCRRLVSRSAALWAALLLAVNLGHLFWSQSIRYFGLLFVLQVISLYSFYLGFERKKLALLLASNAAFALALWTHFSAILLAPVFVGYLLIAWRPREEAGYSIRQYATFFLPFALLLVVFSKSMLDAKALLSTMSLPSARNPLHVMATVVVYCGLPVLGLAAMATVRTLKRPRRSGLLLACCAWIPIAELAVIAQLNLVNVTWYYAIILLFGLMALAGAELASLAERGRLKTAATLGCVSIAYAALHLAGYYTLMHGDRPRWRDAAEYVRQTAAIRPDAAANPQVFANVPGVVAFYLGVAPAMTMGHELVQTLPEKPSAGLDVGEQWFVIEAGRATAKLSAWLDEVCIREASFEARTGPRDRTITVYRYAGAVPATVRND